MPWTAKLEPNDAINPAAFDGCLAFELESKVDEECDCAWKVIDDDPDVVHPQDCHALN